MSVMFYVVIGIYIWRVFVASRKGLIDEVETLIDIIIIAFGVVSSIVVISSVLSKNLISFLVSGIIMMTIVLTRKVLRLVFLPLKWITQLPLIKGLNRFLGLVAGIAEGTIIAWVVLAAVMCWKENGGDQIFLLQIHQNVFLNFLCEHNILRNVIYSITSIFQSSIEM